MKQQLRKAPMINRTIPDEVRRLGIQQHRLATRPLLVLGTAAGLFTLIVYGALWAITWAALFWLTYSVFSDLIWRHWVSIPYQAALDAQIYAARCATPQQVIDRD